ncbi:MAG: glycoside hydrolase family 97 protein [Bacteroidetes bacterium]|nr:glycoside hydrolase family 97 protein [Bacteroidota bacterium]
MNSCKKISSLSLKIIFTFSYFHIFTFATSAQKNIRLTSPNGKIVFTFKIDDKKAIYNIDFEQKQIVANSELALSFSDIAFTNNLAADKPIFREAEENYDLVVGKTKIVHDQYKEVTIPIREISSSKQINLIVRIFNDGLAFRYEFPQQKNWSSFELTDENTTFKLAGNPTAHTLFLSSFTTSHEGKYSKLSFDDIGPNKLMDMPTLFEFPDHIYMAITEAALLDYAGMYLTKEKDALRSALSPLPKQPGIKVKASLPHASPWRVLLISNRIGALIESNIITDLNAPCKIKDISWIKPGKTTFPWWNGNVLPDTINAPGNNFVTQKYYIDFCARNGLEYHSVVEYGLHQWYMDDGISFMPGPHSDPTTPVPGLNMKEVCDYAKSQGVDVRVWVHWWALYPKIDSAFAAFERWGLKGMMIDFMDRDDQEMVNIQTEMLEKAAAHHLHVQFHGAYKNTGLSRTYPNEFTREGTLNYEANKWSREVDPDHDINFPFTRMLAGSTDYHLGGFRAVPDSLYVIQYTRPLMRGTRCHMLAMYVVLENYLGMVCDYPSAYEGQPGFEFLKEVPTVWDETKVLDAKVGEYIVIARRKNNDWYIGAITNHEMRQLTLPFDFLREGQYNVDIYTDAGDVGKDPNHLNKDTRSLNNKDKIMITLASGGGMVMHARQGR